MLNERHGAIEEGATVVRVCTDFFWSEACLAQRS